MGDWTVVKDNSATPKPASNSDWTVVKDNSATPKPASNSDWSVVNDSSLSEHHNITDMIKNMAATAQKNLNAPSTKPLTPIDASAVAAFPMMNLARLALSAAGIPEENVAPAVGQMLGGTAVSATGNIPGAILAAGVGAGVGEAIKQAGKKLRGEDSNFGMNPLTDPIPQDALLTGATEGALKGGANFLFRKQLANYELTQGAGKELSAIKNSIASNPEVQIDASDIKNNLVKNIKNIPRRNGPVFNMLDDWVNIITNRGGKLTGDEAIALQHDLGQGITWGTKKGGALVQQEISNPAFNNLAKDSYGAISQKIGNVASDLGYDNYADLNKTVSNIKSNWPELDPTKGEGSFGSRIVTGSIVGGVTKNKTLGAMTYLGMKALQSPELRNAVFNSTYGAIKSPVGQAITEAGTAGATQGVRSIRDYLAQPQE